MYNRYQLPIEAEPYEPALSFPGPPPGPPPPLPGPPPRPPMLSRPDAPGEGILASLLRHIHLPRLETDDLLLLAITWLLLRDSEDEDLLLILGALLLIG